MKRLKYLFLFFILLGLDQGTKYLARAELMEGSSLPIIPKVLKLFYVENYGAAWGLFSGRASLLSFITLVSVIALIYCFFKIPSETKYTPLRVIIVGIAAGAIGNNLLDRIIHGYVIDFIYFELIDFPVFNVADMYIVIGTALFVLLILLKYKEEDFEFMKRKKVETMQAHKQEDSVDQEERIDQ